MCLQIVIIISRFLKRCFKTKRTSLFTSAKHAETIFKKCHLADVRKVLPFSQSAFDHTLSRLCGRLLWTAPKHYSYVASFVLQCYGETYKQTDVCSKTKRTTERVLYHILFHVLLGVVVSI